MVDRMRQCVSHKELWILLCTKEFGGVGKDQIVLGHIELTICVCVHTQVCICVCVYICAYKTLSICVCACMHICMCTYVFVCLYLCI